MQNFMRDITNKSQVDFNCDMSEGFGNWSIGDNCDLQIMPLISSVNVAAGFHAGDPSLINNCINAAKQHGLGIGVHPGFRDLAGFGRRHINANADELVNDVIYQLGAVREFTKLHDQKLQHLKLHGALYMHSLKNSEFAEKLVTTIHKIEPNLPLLTMENSQIEIYAQKLGHPYILEFFADRHYNNQGEMVFTRNVGELKPQDIANKVIQACKLGTVNTIEGDVIKVRFDSICIHSDTKNALSILRLVRKCLDEANINVISFNKKFI